MYHTYNHACQPDNSSDCINIVLDLSIMVSHLCCHHVTFHVITYQAWKCQHYPAANSVSTRLAVKILQTATAETLSRATAHNVSWAAHSSVQAEQAVISSYACLALQGSYRMLVLDPISFHSTLCD